MPDTKAQPTDHEDPQQDRPPVETGPPAKASPAVTPVVAMTFVIVILLTVLLVIRFGPQRESAEISKLKAELAEVSRQDSPSVAVPGGGEQIQDIATRIRKDAETMVLLSERYQQLVDDTHAEMLRKNADLMRSEQYRQRTTDDLLNLKQELERAKGATHEADSLRREVADLKTVRDEQAKELESLKLQVANLGEMVSKADMMDLQRRFEETLRAKEFFESRVKELEGGG